MPGERTEAPTTKRLQDARKRGQVLHSREVDTAVVVVASLLVLRLAGGMMWHGLESLSRDTWSAMGERSLTVDLAAELATAAIGRALLILAPLFGAIAALSVLGAVAQTGGFVFATEAVKPQFKRMDPMAGAKRLLFSRQAWITLFRSLVKFAVLGIVAWMTLQNRWADLTRLGLGGDLVGSLRLLVEIAYALMLRIALALVAIGAIDFFLQRVEWLREMRMSRDDVKDELKQQEGDPWVKGQLRRARQSLLARVMQNVPKADVVIVNPTHYAVALKYDPATSRAPMVLAKGADLMALRMREVAREHGVPVIENPPLCRAIFAAVRVGQEIPPALYEAVAEVLAFVYRLRTGALRRASA